MARFFSKIIGLYAKTTLDKLIKFLILLSFLTNAIVPYVI